MGEVIQFKQPELQAYRDKMNRFRTQSLFVEYNSTGKYDAYFTLSDKDKPPYVSMRRLYLSIADPTEYEAARLIVGDFKHWQALCGLSWFKEHLDQWRIELDAMLESEAIAALRETASNPRSSSRVTAAKTLLDQPWRKKENLRGRPSKEELEGYIKKAASESSEAEEDYDRIFNKEA